MLATLLASVALLGSAEPICHGQFAPLTKEQQEQANVEDYARQRAEFGFRSDLEYVRELIRRGVWEYDVGYIPVTAEENTYLRLRGRLDLGREAYRYLSRRRDLGGGVSVEDDWPREPYLLVRVTSRPALHLARLKRLARFPDNLRTVEVRYSARQLNRLASRIGRDRRELKAAGFDLQAWGPHIRTNTASVELITARTDHAEYFRNRYGPVTTEVVATSPTRLECVKAGFYDVSASGRSLLLRWSTGQSRKVEQIELVEHPDRVEVGIVERAPNGIEEDDGLTGEHRVALGAPIGDRPVVDAATGRRLLQHGPSPGEPPCPRVRQPSALDELITTRKEWGLPHGRALARRMLHRRIQFTTAERRYIAIREALEFDPHVERYLARHRDEHGGSTIVDRYPAKPYVLIRFTRRLRFHEANLERLAKYPGRLRVIRSEFSSDDLDELANRIAEDAEAGDRFLDGFGDAGFLVEGSEPEDGRVVVRLRTPRDDAAHYFLQRYGAAVTTVVVGDRYECREAYV